ncbi:putative bifunctional diguanylate cyclase/phosphodiesterase [Xanthomonas campestris]|uniref:putative bifunctional diguanylate cyclase/phosphodiesterase n=2 Tax=Xanthomonas TaxID=338 RepID=UPI0015F24E14|nr:EAL domain-containing protein [Xanthomonas campestris]MDX6083202.1 EAL domain-containing protein [Xanthomonas campestris pv. incanae]MDX6085399.1 EAL domain-containing protein [Xanthomonas campestris pv. incanae]MDX6140908.1 EAL domain-containing protein [Xanthomonas campestris pv. incanae]MEA9482107.1 EAL domain-containing protein [Xanthomonas campestris]MEA9489029.1 EAL domain-containing protein [Xanthomonas campestris]
MAKAQAARGTGGGGTMQTVRGWLTLPLALLIVLTGCMAVLSALVIEVQAGATSWIIGESHWSKAQQESVYWLERYLGSADPADLQAACRALEVPLGDRAARLAVDASPIDWAEVYAGLAAGRNAREDMPQMVRLYRYGQRLPYLGSAIALWKHTDGDILHLSLLADRAASAQATGTPDARALQSLRAELHLLDGRMRRDAAQFLTLLTRCARMLHDVMVTCSLATLLLVLSTCVLAIRRTRDYLMSHEGRFRTAFQHAALGMVKFDLSGRVLDANASLANILQYPPEALQACTLAEVMHPDDIVLDSRGLIDWPRLMQAGELRFLRSDGGVLWGRWSASLVEPGPQEPSLVLAVIEDVSQAHELADEVAYHARHDALTGLINRREIERRLQRLIDPPQSPQLCHALCFVDLDHFKLVNDTFGHAVGDKFLCHFADVITMQLRPGDWLGRLGGDEFAILLANTDLAHAHTLLERMHGVLGQPWSHQGGRPLTPSCSFGVVEIRQGADDVNLLMTAADLACHAAKEEGRNRIRSFGETDLAMARRRHDGGWISAVQQAIAEDRLLLYAQKIQVLSDPGRVQYEVLVRMRTRDGRVLSPGEFLPAVERYGLGRMVDAHVLETLCAQLSANPAHVASLDLCHVNLSAQSIAQRDFLDFVCALFERYPTLVAKLCLEITETAVIGDLEHAQRFVQSVRARGCHVALDDFGSGLASFGYLKQFTVDVLKIDCGFVRNYAHDAVDRATVHSIAQVGLALGIEVVAEGVESEADIAGLREAGVGQVQGFSLHRPCPLDDLLHVSLPSLAAS